MILYCGKTNKKHFFLEQFKIFSQNRVCEATFVFCFMINFFFNCLNFQYVIEVADSQNNNQILKILKCPGFK